MLLTDFGNKLSVFHWTYFPQPSVKYKMDGFLQRNLLKIERTFFKKKIGTLGDAPFHRPMRDKFVSNSRWDHSATHTTAVNVHHRAVSTAGYLIHPPSNLSPDDVSKVHMAALGRVHGAGFGDVGAVSARVPDSEGTSFFVCVCV